MSLTGNLEDLPLLDIIQIVSFSKKTGYLAIHVEAQDAAIVFQDGLVVCAYTWESLPLDPRAAGLPRETREKLIRKRIEIALEQLIRLRDGEFHFSLSETVPSHVVARDIRPETLDAGINPQELLLDLARGMDEDRRDSSAVLEASFAHPDDSFDEDLSAVSSFARAAHADTSGDSLAGALPSSFTQPIHAADVEAALAARAPADTPPPDPPAMRDLLELPAPVAIPEAPTALDSSASSGAARRLLLVDDEDDVRGVLAQRFREAGYEVHEADSPEEALKQAARLVKAGSGNFMVVTDLGMPASGGASFQGGFEVVKRLWKMNLRPPVLMMTESLSTALRARARQMGITEFVFKPGLSKLDPEQFEADLAAFGERLVRDVLPGLEQPGAPQPKKPRSEGGASAAAGPGGPAELARQLRTLQQNLEELRERGDASQISLLIMKVAREFFERGLLLLVKGDELRGLGGYGPAPRGESLNLLARDVQIPLAEPSVFRQVTESRRPWSGELPDGKSGGQLLVKVGRFRSTGAALLPLVTHRQTTAVLFGDNPETGRSLERLELLEVFLDQAGVALEKVFLQRKLQSLQS